MLTGIALGGIFFVLDWRSALYAIFAIVISTVLFASLANALAPWGLPALTAPFVFTTWLFIAAAPLFVRLRLIPPAEAGTPEANLQAALGTKGGQSGA